MEREDVWEEEVNDEEIEEEIENEIEEEFYEKVKYLLILIEAIIIVLKDNITTMHRHIERSLRRPITKIGYHFIHNMLKEDPEDFCNLYRLHPNAFLKLCTIIREGGHLEDTSAKYDGKAWNTLMKIRGSTRFYPYFKDCIGAIDGTRIPAMVKGRAISSYRNRHGFQSQNVLATCNFDLKFMYVLNGWEGSAHDSKLSNDALSRRNGLQVPQGKLFLVDCGFANRRQFLAPERGVRYHLKDFGGQGRHPTNAKELFNRRHASLRNVIEGIFGIFKSHFKIFKVPPPFPFQTQAELVLACVGLYNFLRKESRSDEFSIELEKDKSAHGLDMEDENIELLFQSQQQQRLEANMWRTNLANSVWNDRPVNDENENEEHDVEYQDNDNANHEEDMNDEN